MTNAVAPSARADERTTPRLKWCGNSCHMDYISPNITIMENEWFFLPGWTHGLPALIDSLTEVEVFFRYYDGRVENLNAHDSIDWYEHEQGEFCVRNAEEYEEALRQLDEHDLQNAIDEVAYKITKNEPDRFNSVRDKVEKICREDGMTTEDEILQMFRENLDALLKRI